MRFAVVGGDTRSAILCSLLRRDGHRVSTFALEKAALDSGIERAENLFSALCGAKWVILPLPSVKNGMVNAPLSDEILPLTSLADAIESTHTVIGGALSDADSDLIGRHAGDLWDLMSMDEFVVRNASLTAEGAVWLMMEKSMRSIAGSRVLILGFGRIGQLLSRYLRGLGAQVTVAVRSGASRAMASAMGYEGCLFESIPSLGHTFDFIVNTVPAAVLDGIALCSFSDKALIVELAGGFDRELADALGLNVAAAPGLPGKYAPYSAAVCMRDTIYKTVGI